MAGTKKRKKTTRRRKNSRVGATSPREGKQGVNVERALSFALGAVAVEWGVNEGINALTKDGKMKELKNPYVAGGLKMGIGLGGMYYGSKNKNSMLRDAGAGAIAAGGLHIARPLLGIPNINGIGEVWYSDDFNIGEAYPNDHSIGSDDDDEMHNEDED